MIISVYLVLFNIFVTFIRKSTNLTKKLVPQKSKSLRIFLSGDEFCG